MAIPTALCNDTQRLNTLICTHNSTPSKFFQTILNFIYKIYRFSLRYPTDDHTFVNDIFISYHLSTNIENKHKPLCWHTRARIDDEYKNKLNVCMMRKKNTGNFFGFLRIKAILRRCIRELATIQNAIQNT